MFPFHGDQVHQEQHDDHRKDGSEVQVEFLANRHLLFLRGHFSARPWGKWLTRHDFSLLLSLKRKLDRARGFAGAGSYFHFFTASMAALTRMGWPPMTLASLTCR